MNWIKTIPVFSRMMLGFASLLILMLIATAIGQFGLRQVRSAAVTAIDVEGKRAQLAAALRLQILTARSHEKDTFINIDVADKQAAYRQKWQANQDQITSTINAAAAGPALGDEDRRSLDALRAAAAEYAKGFASTVAMIDKGLLGTAEDANREFEKYKNAVQEMETASVAINDRALQAMAAARGPMDAQFQTTTTMQLGLAALSLVVAASVGLLIAQSIRQQIGGELDHAITVVRHIAQGDLAEPIHLAPGDQDSLLAAMAGMQRKLEHIVSDIRGSAVNVATGSAQIASGNQDLSHRTESQSASLQQAAASMEELTTTVSGNAELTRQAVDLAEIARQAAEEGGEVVNRVSGAMERIATTSRRIADINTMIDGIAFQTNILALNAAVEAARAGEQGRGFAVVASEVRSLAQRAAVAAREIKALIGGSVEEVHAGGAHVQHASTSIGQVVERVRTVAELLGQISMATREQATGIGQVSRVVSELDQNTQQNASLVEESAAAASSLNQQADSLVQAVQVFRLQGA